MDTLEETNLYLQALTSLRKSFSQALHYLQKIMPVGMILAVE